MKQQTTDLLKILLADVGDAVRRAKGIILQEYPVGSTVEVNIMCGQKNPTIATVCDCHIKQSSFGGPYPMLRVSFMPKRKPRFGEAQLSYREVSLDDIVSTGEPQ